LLFKLGQSAASGESTYSHYGQEFVLVLKGSLEIVLGDKSYKIKKATASILIPARRIHSRICLKGYGSAMVVTPPSFLTIFFNRIVNMYLSLLINT